MSRRGLALTEILVAAVVAGLSFITFLAVFQHSYRYAAQSRNHSVATVLAQNLMDEIEAHPYGAGEPLSWSSSKEEMPTRIWIKGKPVDMRYHKEFAYRNKSFIGQASDTSLDYDVVNVTISWHEVVGPAQTAVGDNQKLTLSVPVWR